MSEIMGHVIEGGSAIVGAVIGAFGSTIVSKQKKKKQGEERIHLITTNESLLDAMCAADKVCIYAVNSFMWLHLFETELSKNKDAHIKELVVLLRKRDNESQAYLENLDDIIKYWKKLRDDNHQITKLRFYYYTNNPDHYYVIVGDTHILTGHVYEDKDNISGTKVDLQPIVISSSVQDGKEIIKGYQSHFADLLKIYGNNIID